MRRSIERMRREPSDSVGFADGDLSLHLAVANASGNPFMRSIGAAIATALAASFEVSAPPDDPVLAGIAHRQHAAIAEAIRRQDSQGAADAMIAAIRQGLTFSGSPGRLIATLDVQDFPVTANDRAVPGASS
jgi:DNA-binding FadR family transcriptional regulator